jgi:hypothetical protein
LATKNIGLSEPHEEESNEDDAELAPETRAALLDHWTRSTNGL